MEVGGEAADRIDLIGMRGQFESVAYEECLAVTPDEVGQALIEGHAGAAWGAESAGNHGDAAIAGEEAVVGTLGCDGDPEAVQARGDFGVHIL